MSRTAAAAPWLARHAAPLAVVLAVALLALIRWRLLDMPLERDEGEYAYAGTLIRDGLPPYQLAYNMKFPGIYYAYAAILGLFGETPRAVRIGLLLVNGLSIGLLYLWARRLLASELAAAVAAIVFGILSIDQWILGVFAHATHFVVLFAIAGLLLVERGRASGRPIDLLAGGLLLGVSVLMKQNGAFFLGLGALLVLLAARRGDERSGVAALRGLLLVGVGSLAPLLGVAGILVGQGVFEEFWFWTIDYARAYVSEVPWQTGFGRLADGVAKISQANRAIWVLAGIGVPCLWLGGWPRRLRWDVGAIGVVSLLAVSPGLYFREHYFILALPAVALLAGVAVESIRRALARSIPPRAALAGAIVVASLVVGDYLRREWRYLFVTSPIEISRIRYGSNPFAESIEIAQFVAARTDPDDRIAVFGSEPQIYFLARRRSATGYIYAYPLVDEHPYVERMQTRMIEEVEGAQPRIVVFVAVGTSWLADQPDERVVLWADRFLQACYEQIGLVELNRPGPSTFVWDDEVAGYAPRSATAVLIFRKRSTERCVVESN